MEVQLPYSLASFANNFHSLMSVSLQGERSLSTYRGGILSLRLLGFDLLLFFFFFLISHTVQCQHEPDHFQMKLCPLSRMRYLPKDL